MPEKRVTNLVLAEKIENVAKYQKDLKDYIVEDNKKRDIIIEQNRTASNKNALTIAGIKGTAFGISACISFVVSAIGLAWSILKAKVT